MAGDSTSSSGVLTGLLTPPASLDGAATAPSPTEAIAESQDGEAQQYASSYGVSLIEARHVLEIQEKGVEIVAKLKAALGASYAGVWFDRATREFVVAVGPKGEISAAQAVLASLGLVGHSRLITKPWTWSDLETAVAELSTSLNPDVLKGHVRIGIDSERGVQITLSSSTPATRRTAIEVSAAATPVPVQVVVAARASLAVNPESYSEPGDGGPPLIAGMARRKTTGTCTYNYYVTSPVTEGAFYLTAGHCVVPNQKEWACMYGGSPCNWVGHDIGGYEGAAGDEGVLRDDYPGTWSAYPAILNWACGCVTIPVRGVGSSYAGEFVCHTGDGSGEKGWGTTCGEVTSVDRTITYEGGPTVEGLTEVKGSGLCGTGGDSGGPVFDGNTGYALGIWDAGDSGCNTTHYYSEIIHAATVLNVIVQHV